MVTYYHILAPRFKTEKQRAYILSTLSSAFMTLVSTPFVWAYVKYGVEGLYDAGSRGRMEAIGQVGVVFFGVYLFGEQLNPIPFRE